MTIHKNSFLKTLFKLFDHDQRQVKFGSDHPGPSGTGQKQEKRNKIEMNGEQNSVSITENGATGTIHISQNGNQNRINITQQMRNQKIGKSQKAFLSAKPIYVHNILEQITIMNLNVKFKN